MVLGAPTPFCLVQVKLRESATATTGWTPGYDIDTMPVLLSRMQMVSDCIVKAALLAGT